MVPVKIPYLKDDDDIDRLQSTKTEKVSEAFAATITMNPIDWSILPYVLKGATADTYAIGDTNYDIALGQIDASDKKIASNYRFRIGSITKTFTSTIILQLMFNNIVITNPPPSDDGLGLFQTGANAFLLKQK